MLTSKKKDNKNGITFSFMTIFIMLKKKEKLFFMCFYFFRQINII